MLTISVKNFGPIAEGSVDLKPLTIFVGPSNTGKSYMATAVHAVMRAASHQTRASVRRNQLRDPNWGRRISFVENQRSDIPLRSLQNWVQSQVGHISEPSEFTLYSLPWEVRAWLETAITEQLRNLQISVVERLRQIHGESTEFTRRGTPSKEFRLEVHQDGPLLNLEIQLNDSSVAEPRFDIVQSAIPNVAFNLPLNFQGADEELWLWDEVATNLAETASQGVISGLTAQSYYLPAARSGISQGHKVLSAALVRQSSFIGLQELHIPTLPGITTEFLSYLIGLDKRMGLGKNDEALRKAIDHIENDVLRGSIDLDDSDGLPYPEIVYRPQDGQQLGHKFSLERTSSMVSELAPVILFLKYLIYPGHLLILEEPESHLHPAAQLQMARGIARLVNAGVQVLITTHSNDFTGQINNLISMSNVGEETASSMGLEQEECLQPEQVSAYGFRIDPDKGGAVTYRLPVGSDVGIEDQEFLPVVELLYEQAITLQRNRLT